MALTIVNLDEIKKAELEISDAKTNYDDSLKLLKDTINNTINFWQGEDADLYRERVNHLIDNELSNASYEMEYEKAYLNKVSTVLENAQEQVKNRLNGV